MHGQERIRRLIAHQPADRVGIFDSFWWETEHEFHQQGMPDGVAAEDYFELDAGMFWFDQSFRLSRRVLEEHQDHRVVTDEWGTRHREFTNHQTTPGLIDFAVKDRESWAALKPNLIYDSTRLDWPALRARYGSLRDRGRYVMLSVLDPFEATWHKVGPEQQLMLLALDPDFLRDMYESDTALLEAAWEDLSARGLQPDALWIFGDIAYNKGLLFSPKHYRQVLMPYHCRLCDLAHRHGCQVIYHSDGDVSQAIPLLIEAGIDCLHPLEVKAGMDVLALKRDWGDRLAFMGNIDARLFQANDLAGLEVEIQTKIPPAMRGGGYIYHSDHSVPPGTQLDTYRCALDLVRRYGRYG
jgi:uroporphyrinogen decarboxylase